MKIPIGPFYYEVNLVHKLQLDGRRVRGYCDTFNMAIYINADMPPTRRATTVYHEIAHAVIDTFGLTQKRFSEEAACEIIALFYAHINAEIWHELHSFLQVPQVRRVPHNTA